VAASDSRLSGLSTRSAGGLRHRHGWLGWPLDRPRGCSGCAILPYV